jgi:hypothetical protein
MGTRTSRQVRSCLTHENMTPLRHVITVTTCIAHSTVVEAVHELKLAKILTCSLLIAVLLALAICSLQCAEN